MSRVYLIGFMGAGKSSVAGKLASTLGYSKLDLDKQIEIVSGQSIPAFFGAHGEDEFRKLESDTLRATRDEEQLLVSCGGGTPFYMENLEWMKSNGQVVFINTKLEHIISRLKQSNAIRPMIMTEGVLDEEKVRTLYEERLSTYKQADFIWDPEEMSIEDLTEKLS